MKKVFIVLMAGLMLTACGGKSTETVVETAVAETSTVDAPSAPNEEEAKEIKEARTVVTSGIEEKLKETFGEGGYDIAMPYVDTETRISVRISLDDADKSAVQAVKDGVEGAEDLWRTTREHYIEFEKELNKIASDESSGVMTIELTVDSGDFGRIMVIKEDGMIGDDFANLY